MPPKTEPQTEPVTTQSDFRAIVHKLAVAERRLARLRERQPVELAEAGQVVSDVKAEMAAYLAGR